MNSQLARRTIVLLGGMLLFVAGTGGLSAETSEAALAVTLKDAPPNIWVKVCESNTGARELPLFVYVPEIKKFVMASGLQTPPGHDVFPRHYDTEEFNLAALKWSNAYPPAMDAGRPESGPVGEDYSKAVEHMNWGGGGEIFYKDGALLRIGCGGQWLVTKLNNEYAYVPENGKVYAYLYDKTICYDPVARLWRDLDAKPRTSCRIWGSMCYDPVNKEILHSGGDGGSTDICTWAYSPEKNEWRKLEFNSAKLKALGEPAKQLRWQAKALLGACCNRFAVSETKAEAKADLAAQATALAAAAEKFAREIKAARLTGTDKTAGEVAIKRLESATAALKTAGPGMSGRILQDKIAAIRAIRVIFEQVVDALAIEPPGRARSQTAYDPVHKKIVLFGGDGLDRVLSDTWLYDCVTRTWEQKFPEKCPAPRAGHVLAWLPKSGQIVLAGGYSRVDLPQEIWSYDVTANAWKLLLHVPLKTAQLNGDTYTHSPNAPRNSGQFVQYGAVDGDDVLVCPSPLSDNYGRYGGGLVTWACKVDPAKADETGSATNASISGSYSFNSIDPTTWENAAKPEPEKTKAFLKSLPANQWTALKFPMYAPGAQNRWGTTAYDTDRHQLLFWGGGHSTSCENDVSHFSMLGGFWTVGYHPDDPIERIYASVPTPLSFNDRVHVPMHAYKTYDYDPTAGKMFHFDRAYNPAVREWDPISFPGLEHRGILETFLAPTPKGMVAYSANGLFRFEAARGRWQKLPWNGPDFGGIYCDGGGLRYDSKRDCLWLANEKAIFRYDLATNTATDMAVKKPKVLGQFFFWGEEVHLPDADLILIMRRFQKPDGTFSNVVWDPANSKFYWADLTFMENDKPVEFKDATFSWSDALRYDPELKLSVLNNCSAYKVWVLKFDRASAKLTEIVD